MQPKVAISSCLLGQEVRFDGQHKRTAFLVDHVSEFVEYVPVCPELELGMGVPREPIQLVAIEGGGTQLLGTQSRTDWTDSMQEFAMRRVEQLKQMELCGYVLKKDSPSCGMERVKVWRKEMPKREGRGKFAEVLMREMPHLPVEEEGRLNDPNLCQHFFVRVFAQDRLRRFFSADWTIGDLVKFHSKEKFLLLAHDETRYRKIGPIVANAKQIGRSEVEEQYSTLFQEALAQRSTYRQHVNVLQHLAGFLREHLNSDQREHLHQVIEDYRGRLVPVIVPVTLIRHFVEGLDITYLKEQTYLAPHPKQLKLYNST